MTNLLQVLLCIFGLFVAQVSPVPLNFNEPSKTTHSPPTTTTLRSVSSSSPASVSEGPPPPRGRRSEGCRYQGTLYEPGTLVATPEKCLTCTCKGSVVVCKLRVCPDVPDVPPPGCIVLHKAQDCCAQLICNAPPDNFLRKLSRDQTLPGTQQGDDDFSSRALVSSHTLSSGGSVTTSGGGGCVQDGTVYAEGSAMRSSTLCQHCFCIRGRMTCSEPACLIPLPGCVPKFRSYACCPTNYDCSESRNSSVVKSSYLEVPSLSSTQVPSYLKGCRVGESWVAEGEPVLPLHLANTSSLCQTCFCMGGIVTCSALECAKPIDSCTPVIQDGHCCPDRYECVGQTEPPLEEEEQVTPEMVTSNDIFGTGRNSDGSVTEEILQVVTMEESESSTIVGETIFPESLQESMVSLGSTGPVASVTEQVPQGWSQVGGFKMLSGRANKKEGRRDDWTFYSSEEEKYSSSSADENSSSRLFEDPVSDKSTSDSEETADLRLSTTLAPTTDDNLPTDIVTLIIHDEQTDTPPPSPPVTSAPSTSSPSTSTTPTATAETHPPSSPTLEFIPFGVEDALFLSPPTNPNASLHYEVHPPPPPPQTDTGKRSQVIPPEGYLSLRMRPLKLQDPPPEEGGSPVPLLVEDPSPLLNSLPGGSLYSHGYYGVPSDPLSQEETSLIITQAELDPPTTTTKSPPPSFPSRTYSKFGIQDSSFRYTPGGFVPIISSNKPSSPPPPHSPDLVDSPWRPGPLTVSSPLSSVVVSSPTKPGKASKIIMAKPMKRKGSSGNVEFHPVVAFPFPLGDTGGGLVGGLKLSGCNIYGKTVRVGSIIHELSSICVQCLCSEMGVQCSELQC